LLEELEENGTAPGAIADRVWKLLTPVEKAPPEVPEKAPEARTYKRLSDITRRVISDAKWRQAKPGAITGIPTGIIEVDETTLGFQPGEVVFVGARTGIGKTNLAINWLKVITGEYKIPALLVNMEMNELAIVRRFLSAMSGIWGRTMRDGTINEVQLAKLRNTADRIADYPLYIADQKSGIRTVQQIRQLYTEMKAAGIDIKVIVIDHLHLLKHNPEGGGNRYSELTEITGSVRRMAAELEVPVIALCQMSRPAKATKYSKNNKPAMSDLRDSGSLEQDADHIILIHYPHSDDLEVSEHEAWLLIKKNREGEPKDIEVFYDRKQSLFQSVNQPTRRVEILKGDPPPPDTEKGDELLAETRPYTREMCIERAQRLKTQPQEE
ncbi:MAG: DnaB-like helicase C-terminal domain-containing protein, partial [Terriglobales bacterium]